MKLNEEQIFGLYCNSEKFILYDTPSLLNIIEEKLILRTYEDMTEEEIIKLIKINQVFEYSFIVSVKYNALSKGCFVIQYQKFDSYFNETFTHRLDFSLLRLTAESFEYLISIGIDVFGAIEQGYAVREETK